MPARYFVTAIYTVRHQDQYFRYILQMSIHTSIQYKNVELWKCYLPWLLIKIRCHRHWSIQHECNPRVRTKMSDNFVIFSMFRLIHSDVVLLPKKHNCHAEANCYLYALFYIFLRHKWHHRPFLWILFISQELYKMMFRSCLRSITL